jgi:magnesium-transporting ATPase (P-type)
VQQWHVERAWGWFPIVAFNSDIETFTKMNSYAIVLTSVAVLSLFIFQVFAHYQSQRMYKIYAWYLGIVMLLVQYAILIYINALVRFSISTDLWLIFVSIILFATVILYLWWRVIRQWKFRQYFKKSTATCAKNEKNKQNYGEIKEEFSEKLINNIGEKIK